MGEILTCNYAYTRFFHDVILPIETTYLYYLYENKAVYSYLMRIGIEQTLPLFRHKKGGKPMWTFRLL